MPNCEKPWSIRRRRPRCSASSAASPTDVQPVLDAIVESAAKVCGIDDVALRLLEESSLWLRGGILVPCPIARAEISIDEPQYRWIREHGTLHIPDIRAQNDFPTVGSHRSLAHFLSPLLFVSTGKLSVH